MTLPREFTSPAALRDAFAQGLEAMLGQHDGLGVYILVLANACYDPELWTRLSAPLARRHEAHADRLTAALRRGGRLEEPEDDLLVFLKLMAIGLPHLGAVARRQAGPWQIQFNPLRALRPPRASSLRVEGLRQPFDPQGFHFNKPFLAKEVLWQGELAHKPARLLYNKFPFAPLHGLLVPEPERELAQWLTPALFDWAWEVTGALAAAIPGFGLAYNSYGAYASVNHLHFQSFVQTAPLPVQSAHFAHHGGGAPYPLPCQVATERQEAWFALDELHRSGTPYNLLFGPDRVHILARAAQGSRPPAPWSAGFAWSEMAGAMTVFSQEDFAALAETDIALALSQLRP